MKKNLILLHGAIGASKQFIKLSEHLEKTYHVYTFDFDGHGGTNLPSSFSIDLFSQNLIDFIRNNNLNPVYIFGYSMGGYVALHAISKGLIVERLVTLGTKFSWTPEGAAKEIRMLNPTVIEEKLPQFAQYQNTLHSPSDWKAVMRATADMMVELGNDPSLKDKVLMKIETPTLCLLGDQDTMVSKEETKHVVSLLSNSTFEIIEDCQHPIEKVPLQQLTEIIEQFFG